MVDFDPKELGAFDLYRYTSIRHLYLTVAMLQDAASRMHALTLWGEERIKKDEFQKVINEVKSDHHSSYLETISLFGHDGVELADGKQLSWTRPEYLSSENKQRNAWASVRDLLFESALPSFCFNDDLGMINEIPQVFWSGQKSLDVLSTSTLSEGNHLGLVGSVVIRKDDVTSIIADEIRWLESESVVLPIEKVQDEVSHQTDFHLSPYLQYLVYASTELKLINGHMPEGSRMPSKHIKAWLEENWWSELGTCSENKLLMMTTIIRNPEDGRGGRVAFEGEDRKRLIRPSSNGKPPN